MDKNFKQNKGITLIALVITIIVLLILAGISISMLTGNNGILQKATDAKTNTDNAQIKERIQLSYHSALTGGQGNYTKDSLEEELEKEFGENNYSVDDSDNTNWIITAQGQSITVPSGNENTQIPTISFILYSRYDGTTKTCYAKQGMTFKEWIDEYTPEGITYNGYIFLTANDYFVLTGNGYTPSHFAMEWDTITDGAAYSFYYDD